MLTSNPARMVNQKIPSMGIPPDSIQPKLALGGVSVLPKLGGVHAKLFAKNGMSADALYQGSMSLTHRALVKPVRRLSISKA